MLLNRIWIGMFLVAFVVAASKLIFWHDTMIFKQLVDSLFAAAETGFAISIGLTGMICLWMGIMKVGEEGGAVRILTKLVAPLFSRLFPEVPKDHPAVGAMMMNFSANMLGLDNAATPIGLKAMGELQKLNPDKETASNAQIMFLVLNTSGLTIIPVSVFAILAANGAASPSSVFLPILMATFCASLVGLTVVSIKQRINLLNRVVFAYLGTITLLLGGLLYYIITHPENGEMISNIFGNTLIFVIIVGFMLMAIRKKVNVYESFVSGAKDGFSVAIKIIPYLIAMLAAIAVFRASGSLDAVLGGFLELALYCGITATEWIDALPVGFMKPLSGSGARGALQDIINAFGPNSMQTKIASTMQGSTETTFYVLAVYFGSVGIKNTRYAAGVGLIADFAGIIAAIIISYLFYSNV
ncbi:MAG: spore maturation protein SpmA [Flavobacteriaceae bacterium]|jgi:spore maturation protein SpmA